MDSGLVAGANGDARISEAYRQLNAELHQRNPTFGVDGSRHYKTVSILTRRYRCRTVLDYGCGKGMLKQQMDWLNVRNYDPAIPEFSGEPSPADLVICADVMEHIEPDKVDAVLDHLQRLTLKALFMEISIVPAHKTLSDGRNAHLSIHPISWWMEKLLKRFDFVSAEAAVNLIAFQITITAKQE